MRSPRGVSLATTLVVITLISTLAFTLAGLSVHHLFVLRSLTGQDQARAVARSAMASAIEKLMKEKPPEVNLVLGAGVGRVTFDAQVAKDAGLPLSVNNLKGDMAVAAPDGRSVAPGTAYLQAVGRHGSVERRVEAVLSSPPFPYALAAGGKISCLGGLRITGVRRLPGSGSLNPQSSDETPAHLLSNSSAADAIELGPNSVINGNLEAVGSVKLLDPASTSISGEIRNQSQPEKLPPLDTSRYDPRLHGDGAYDEYSGAGIDSSDGSEGKAPQLLEGALRHSGKLTITDGLRLNGAMLFVDGDLDVSGGIEGQGVIVTTGSATVRGSSELRGATDLALVAGKDLTLQGSGRQGSYFQGMVWSGGQFKADRISVVGTLIAQGDATLTDAGVYSTRSSRKVTVKFPKGEPVAPTGGKSYFLDPATALPIAQRPNNGEMCIELRLEPLAGPNGTYTMGLFSGPLTGGKCPTSHKDLLVVTSSRTGEWEQALSELTLRVSLAAADKTFIPLTGAYQAPAWTDQLRLTDNWLPKVQAYFNGGAEFDQYGEKVVDRDSEVEVEEEADVTVDPSSLMKLQDRVRVSYWREF